MIENNIKEKFRELKLGEVRSIEKADYAWEKGDVYYVSTWLKKYVVHELDGEVNSIKNGKKDFYRK